MKVKDDLNSDFILSLNDRFCCSSRDKYVGLIPINSASFDCDKPNALCLFRMLYSTCFKISPLLVLQFFRYLAVTDYRYFYQLLKQDFFLLIRY